MSWEKEKKEELLDAGFSSQEAEKLLEEEKKKGKDLQEQAEWVPLETDGYEG